MLNRQYSASTREKSGTANLVLSVIWIKRLSATAGLSRK